MHFNMKSTLKNNHNHTLKQILIRTQPKSNNQITKNNVTCEIILILIKNNGQWDLWMKPPLTKANFIFILFLS